MGAVAADSKSKKGNDENWEGGAVLQLDEEKRLKEMKGEVEEEDNRTKISISNQPVLKKSILHNRCE